MAGAAGNHRGEQAADGECGLQQFLQFHGSVPWCALEIEGRIALLVQLVTVVLGTDVFHDVPVAVALVAVRRRVRLEEHGRVFHAWW